MADQPLRALIFDSGLGGLSVFQEIAARLPHISCIYAADTAFFPCGTKDADGLTRRLLRLMAALAARYRPDIAVIAYNTASTIANTLVVISLSVFDRVYLWSQAYLLFAGHDRVIRHDTGCLSVNLCWAFGPDT